MRRFLRIVGIGCGGLIALVVMLVIAGVLIGGLGNVQQGFEEGRSAATGESSSDDQSSSPDTNESAAKGNQSAAQKPATTATVRVTGTPDIPFSGSYGNVDGQRSVDGAVPADYEVNVRSGPAAFDVVSTTFQKLTDDDSELRVQILSNGEVQREQSTTAAFGVVTVVWNTSKQ